MFCQNCGTNVADDAAFCHVCGYQFGTDSQPIDPAQPYQPVAPSQLATGPIRIPGLSKLISAGIALFAFIFSFLPLISYSMSYSMFGKTGGESKSYGVLSSETSSFFEGMNDGLPFFLVLARIFLIVGIVLFVAYIASLFVNIKSFVPALKLDIDKLAPIVYFGVMALFVLCTLIGCISSEMGMTVSSYPGICWYFELIFVAAGCVLAIKPDLLAKFGLKG